MALAALLASPTFAQRPPVAPPTASRILVDPIDGHTFEHSVITSTNGMGGWDSDGCSYAQGPQPRGLAIATSPTTLYSAPWEQFRRELSDAQKEELLRRLSAIGSDVEDARKLSPAERFELAALVAEYLGDSPYAIGDLFLAGAWTVRDTVVGFLPGLQGAGNTWQELVELMPVAAAVADPRYKSIALFDMARIAHRGGFPVERDDFLAVLDTLNDAPPDAAGKRLEFLGRVAREDQLLGRAREAYRKALAQGLGTGADRARYRFLVGDLSRRLGDFDEARTQLEAVSLDQQADAETAAKTKDGLAVLRVQARESTMRPSPSEPAAK